MTSVSNCNNVENHGCVVQTGAITIASDLSDLILDNTLPRVANGGKINISSLVHIREKASIAIASGSGFQATYGLSWKFNLDATNPPMVDPIFHTNR